MFYLDAAWLYQGWLMCLPKTENKNLLVKKKTFSEVCSGNKKDMAGKQSQLSFQLLFSFAPQRPLWLWQNQMGLAKSKSAQPKRLYRWPGGKYVFNKLKISISVISFLPPAYHESNKKH